VDFPSSALPDYAELFAFTNFSFLRGASHGEELVLRASQLGYSGLAVTDVPRVKQDESSASIRMRVMVLRQRWRA